MKIFSLFFLLLFSIAATETFAVDFTVNLTTDEHDASTGDGICDIDTVTAGEQCTLRAAVEQANALPSNDRVLFSLPASSTITLTTANGGEIPIDNNGTLEIVGTGANNLTINGGAGTNRIFYTNGAVVTISGVTLTGGNGTGTSSGNGGAIYANGGTLTLDRVHITQNSAGAGFAGGGVFFSSGTNHRIINSTFSVNQAPDCAGFYNFNGTLTVVNSTISGNTASTNVGGGFCSGGASSNTTLRNVTITNNAAPNGGGIYHFGGSLNFGNTIIAGNRATAPNGVGPEIFFVGSGSITSAGNNLVGDSTGDAANTNVSVTYQTSDIQDRNPMLGVLQNNVGQTPTHALLSGSPAIDAGSNALAVDPSNGNAALTTDQRGLPRIVDGDGNGTSIVDIGAFEVQSSSAAPATVSGRVLLTSGRGLAKAMVILTDMNGQSRVAMTNPFGYYRFADVAVGEIYIINVRSKKYNFSPQVITVNEDIENLIFFLPPESVFTKN